MLFRSDVAMIEQADYCIVAADKTKFWRSAFAKIGDISVADYLVTNTEFSSEHLAEIEALGIKII